MRWILTAVAAAALLAPCSKARARPLLHNPVALNIGVNCRWETRCMALQNAAMKRALRYVATAHPPQHQVQLCNRNARRGGDRVDWIGYDHCIRNRALRRPARPVRRSRRR